MAKTKGEAPDANFDASTDERDAKIEETDDPRSNKSVVVTYDIP